MVSRAFIVASTIPCAVLLKNQEDSILPRRGCDNSPGLHDATLGGLTTAQQIDASLSRQLNREDSDVKKDFGIRLIRIGMVHTAQGSILQPWAMHRNPVGVKTNLPDSRRQRTALRD